MAHVHGFPADFSHRIEHRESKRNIGYEDTVHDIHVEPVGLALVDHLNFLVQMEEIGREQGRRYDCFHHFVSSDTKTAFYRRF